MRWLRLQESHCLHTLLEIGLGRLAGRLASCSARASRTKEEIVLVDGINRDCSKVWGDRHETYGSWAGYARSTLFACAPHSHIS